MNINEIDEIRKIDMCLAYIQMIEDYNKDNDIEKDFNYITSSLPIMSATVDNINSKDVNNFDKNIDKYYWMLKAMANTVNFIKTMKPIMSHFNPSDEDKARFVEYIKKMEENKDE